MKRKIISVFLAIALFMSLVVIVSAAQETTFVVDEADLLTDREESTLSGKLLNVSEAYDAQIVIITLSSTEGRNIDYFVESLYDEMGLGYGKNHDGVLLLVCMDIREYRILSNGFAAAAITSSDIDSICDAIVSDLSDGNYNDAFEEFADQCAYYLDGYVNGFPFDLSTNLLIALVIGIVIGLIVALVLAGQLKSVRRQDQANVYVKPGSMYLSTQSDLFLYRNISRTRRESSKSSSSGSSRHTGGGSF